MIAFRRRRGEAVAELDGVQVGQQFVVEQGQPVADAEVVFQQRPLPAGGVPRDGELRPAGPWKRSQTASMAWIW